MSCTICGENLNEHYVVKLGCACGSQYHYECIFNTLKNDRYRKCPLCATPNMKLPVVNGIKKINPFIHIVPDEPMETIMCQSILKSGKNKGGICGKNCKIGFNVCQRHFKIEG